MDVITSDNETIRRCVTAYVVAHPRTPERELQGLRSGVRQMATSAGFALAARMPERSPCSLRSGVGHSRT